MIINNELHCHYLGSLEVLRGRVNKILLIATAIFMMLFIPGLATAAQEFKVKDGDTITVKISSRELTRITISGEGRLEKVWGSAGILEIQPDKDKGEIFVRPTNVAPAALSFFVRDDMGSTYTVVAQQHDIPSETIVIKPSTQRKSKSRSSKYRSTPFVETVKRLMKSMALGDSLDGYSYDDVESEVELWAETEITLRRIYSGYELLGEVYTIKNISDEEMNFHEREFLDFGDRVQAAALERLSLNKGESTFLYVVRKPEGDK